MLKINMQDVLAVLQLVVPYLIALAIILLAGLIVFIAVRKRPRPQRGLVRGITGAVVILSAAIVANGIAFGPMSSLLDLVSGKGTVSEQTTQEAKEVAAKVAGEGIVLMQNNDDLLPLASGSKVNLFGWASANPVYGGSGSGGINNLFPTVSYTEGLEQAGIEINKSLIEFYNSYGADRPEMSIEKQSWTLPEPPVSQYPQDLLTDAKSFSDVAFIMISRMAGEGHTDMPTDVSQAAYDDNSPDYSDFEAGEHYLQLSRSEADMVDMVTKNFDDVVLIYNGANPIELGFVNDYPSIKSVIWSPGPGNVGFSSLGKIITGEINPSGHATDTFVYDLTAAPWWNNQKKIPYSNMTHLAVEGMNAGRPETFKPSFINYNEGIYVGYKFYETAAAEGLIDYDSVVQYPFGHGMSYTKFSQEMSPITQKNGLIDFDVTVTNTGDFPGKEVVQIYSNPPYYDGGIEKSSANLVSIAKTDVLEPGQSQVINIEIALEDLASYDTAGRGSYVLESGQYVLSINSDSHNVIDSASLDVQTEIRYDETNPRSSDKTSASNLFQAARGTFTCLSRKNGFANFSQATAAPSELTLPEPLASEYHTNANSDVRAFLNPDDKMPTTGAKKQLELADLRGADYDDARWDTLLDQMTVEEMMRLVSLAGYQTPAVSSVGKFQSIDSDGPAAINNNFTGQGSIGFPVEVVIASTFNPDLANEYGKMMGKMSRELGSSGWYAPGVNTHRIALGARNYEYFSEDGLLAGIISAEAIKGAASEGVYSFAKHFALYDFNGKMVSVWADEQAIREIYLKPFELSVKKGNTKGIMISWSYIGNKWAGEWSELNNKVLREEWGFQGFTVTDYFRNNGHGFMNADLALANGVDAMLSTFEGGPNNISDPSAPTSILQLRHASKNIMFTVVNSWVYGEDGSNNEIPSWKIVAFAVDGAVFLLVAGLVLMARRRYLADRK